MRPKRKSRERAELRTWLIALLPFTAYTRSEARALAKSRLGIRRKGRLPVGMTVREEIAVK